MDALEELQDFLDKEVVIDTKSNYIYLGKLTTLTENFITLADVDIHDNSECTITKEVYVMEARKFGIKVNRNQTKLVRQEMISISLLEDVIAY